MNRGAHAQLCRLIFLTLPFLLIAGCPPVIPDNKPEDTAAALRPFASDQELLNYFRDQVRAFHVQQRGGMFGLPLFAGQAPFAEDAASGGTNGAADDDGDTPYTGTNIQEQGVDESDVFKTDGEYFYIARGRTLRIVQATPLAELQEVARIELQDAIDELYLQGDRLVVIGSAYGPYGAPEVMIWPPYRRAASVLVAGIDVSDPANPDVQEQNRLDGSLVTSRLIDSHLVLVLTVAPDISDNPSPSEIDSLSLETVLPKMKHGQDVAPLVPAGGWLRPLSPDGYNATAIVTLNASNVQEVIGSTAVLANAGTIYASTEALYVTDAAYHPEYGDRERTAIHKLAFDENGVAQYVASGSVPGRLLNQFALGESNGYLRVATHVNQWNMFMGFGVAEATIGPGGTTQDDNTVTGDDAVAAEPEQPYNAVYVLAENGTALDAVGGIEDIAPGEQIYAARFMSDHGFLVTYRQVDPLFVIDLKDPANPRLLGELKVPGYSDYLHPVDDTHLIGVGKFTVTDQGMEWFQGVQVSLFDVSDWENPQVVEQLTLGGRGSESAVSYTHKAFSYLTESNLLALPARLVEDDGIEWGWSDPTFDGVVVFQVDLAEGFTELGRVAALVDTNDWYGWRRAAIIGDTVYALSVAGVRGAPLSDFEATNELEFEPLDDEWGDQIWPGLSGGMERGGPRG